MKENIYKIILIFNSKVDFFHIQLLPQMKSQVLSDKDSEEIFLNTVKKNTYIGKRIVSLSKTNIYRLQILFENIL